MIDVLFLFREAVAGTLLIALGCSIIGVWVVYRRIVFVAATLAQLSSAGVAFALLLAGPILHRSGHAHIELVFSGLFTLAGVLAFALAGERGRVPQDARLGMAYVLAGAVAVLMVARTAGADAHDLFARGNILAISGAETRILAVVVGTVLLVHALFHKEFLFVSFDAEMAATLGYRVGLWNLLLFLTLGIVIAVSMASAGVLLVFSFLVLPAITGVALGGTLLAVVAGAAMSGVLAAGLGFAVSIPLDLPTAPTIVATAGLFALVARTAGALARRRRRVSPEAPVHQPRPG
jgi:zinc transport system permease protein